VPIAEGTVAGDHLHRRVPGAAKIPSSLASQGGVIFDGDNGAARPGEVGEERGVEAGGGTDLKDRVPRFGLELFEHARDEVRAGRRTCRRAIGGALRDHGLAAVGSFQICTWQKLVAGNGAECLLDAGGLKRSPAADPVSELVPQRHGPVLAGAGNIRGRHGTDCSHAPGQASDVRRGVRHASLRGAKDSQGDAGSE
jgi:hypothetical protein